MGMWTALSSDDYYAEQECFDRYVEMTCECGLPVMVPYRDGPPLGPLRCAECQEMADRRRQDERRAAACAVARVTTQRKET